MIVVDSDLWGPAEAGGTCPPLKDKYHGAHRVPLGHDLLFASFCACFGEKWKQ